ncbi:MAG: hypothetical protein ACFFE2_10395 [Candidatus Thorarchaeota archaeon]
MRRFTLILILCTLVIVSPIQANAQPQHGLYWGVVEGQILNYTIKATGGGQSVSFDLYYVIVDLPEIPDIVNGPEDISFAAVAVFDENDTYIDGLWLDYMGHFPTGLPAGNWSLITNIFVTAWEGFDDRSVSQTPAAWSIHQTGTSFFGDYIIQTHTHFSKSDGMLNKMVWEASSGLEVSRVVLERKSTPNLIVPLAIAGFGALVVSSVVIVLWRKRTPAKVYHSEVVQGPNLNMV